MSMKCKVPTVYRAAEDEVWGASNPDGGEDNEHVLLHEVVHVGCGSCHHEHGNVEACGLDDLKM